MNNGEPQNVTTNPKVSSRQRQLETYTVTISSNNTEKDADKGECAKIDGNIVYDAIQSKKMKVMNRKRSMLTLKTIRLSNMIIEQVTQRHIINDLSNLLKLFNRQEISNGFHNGLVDKHTLLRNIKRLEDQGKIRFIQVKLSSKCNSRKLEFICEPHIDKSHPFIQSVIDQSKLLCANTGTKRNLILQKSLNTVKGFSATKKFIKMKLFHKFIFYVVYDHKNKIGNIDEVIPNFSQSDSGISPSEMSTVYENAPENFLFVPPAQKHMTWSDGWFFMADLLFNMPLCLFVKLITLSHVIPSLLEYCKHPLKCQILVKNLPKDIQMVLFWKRRYIFSMYEVLERLCYFGLVKFGKRIMKEKERVFVYINRNASLFNTTVSNPSYFEIEEREYDCEYFNFKTGLEVEEYWNRLQYICVNTKMGCLNEGVGKQIEFQSPEIKMAYVLKNFSKEEAMASDDGSIPGDHRGAGGFDTCLYTHVKKSWSTHDLPIKPIIKKEAEALARSMPSVDRKPPLNPRSYRRMNIGKIIKKGKHFVRTIMPRFYRKSRRPAFDEIDKIALKNLTSQRCIWMPNEDRLMVLIKTAIEIMFSKTKSVPISTVRDILHCGTRIADKTSASCRRRLLHIKKKKAAMRNVEIYLTELKQNINVCQRYGDYYTRMQVKESSDMYAEFINECRIHFVELVHYLHKIFYSKSTESKQFSCLPTKLQDVYDKYHINLTHDINTLTVAWPTDITEIKHSAIHNLIHTVLSCEYKKVYSKSDFLNIYRQFPEDMLRDALQKIKSSAMVAAKKKTRIDSNDSPTEMSSYFHLSQAYIFQACTSTPFSIFSEMFSHMDSIIQSQSRDFKPEVLDSGCIALLLDLNDTGLVELLLTIPKNLLIIDPRLADASCSMNDVDNSVFQDDDKCSSNASGVIPTRYVISSLKSIAVDIQSSHVQDYFALNSCELGVTVKCDLRQKFYEPISGKIEDLFAELTRNIKIDYNFRPDIDFSNFESCDVGLSKEVFSFVDSKQHMGASNSEIKSHFSLKDYKVLKEIFRSLENSKFIFRVGISKTHWISIHYIDTWFIQLSDYIEKKYKSHNDEEYYTSLKRKTDDNIDENPPKKCHIDETISADLAETNNELIEKSHCSSDVSKNNIEIGIKEDVDIYDHFENDIRNILCSQKILYYLNPRPWIKLNGSVNQRVLWRWSAAILTYMISHPILRLTDIHKRFSFMFPHHLRLLVEMLEQIGCVKLILISHKKVSFWEDFEGQPNIGKASIFDDSDKIFVEMLENALITFSLYKGFSMKLINTE